MENKRFSSNTDEWGSPLDKFAQWNQEFKFTLDPCGTKARLLPDIATTYTKKDNGLTKNWKDHRVFVNPPYSDIKTWCKKCYDERNNAELIVLLMFARTDTSYFHEYINNIAEVRFIRGRLKFFPIEHPNMKMTGATFASILCIYRRR